MDSREAFLLSRKNLFNQTMGIPKTPVQVAYRMVDMGRALGKTRIMIEALPEDGNAIIVVWNRAAVDHIQHAIMDVRGREYPVKALRFMLYEEWKRDRGARFRGRRCPVFVDNSVHDMLSVETTEWINSFWNNPPCESTPTSIDTSEKSSSRSRKRSKKSATDEGSPSQS